MRNLKKAIELVLRAENICVACHESPDGDAIGSLVAFGRGLTQLSKDVYLLSPDGVPAHLLFLTEGVEIRNSPPQEKMSLLIIVDAESRGRLGKAKEVTGEKILIIDHHPPSPSGEPKEVRLVDEGVSATGEIVYELLKRLSVEFTPQIVEALLSAILSDTGGLRFPNTTPKTLNIVAELMRKGGNLSEVYRKLYEDRSEGYLKVLGEVLLRARTVCNGKAIISYVFSEDYERYRVKDKDLEGIVDYLRLQRGCEVAFLLRERGNDIRVSIRSRSLDAGSFARIFGGGGHEEAAGCTIRQPLEEAQNTLMEELKKWMAC